MQFHERRLVGQSLSTAVAAQSLSRPSLQPSQPSIKCFNGRLRAECLIIELFRSMSEIHGKLATWQGGDFNHKRPHSSIGYLTPLEFASRQPHGPSASLMVARPEAGSVKGGKAPLTLSAPCDHRDPAIYQNGLTETFGHDWGRRYINAVNSPDLASERHGYPERLNGESRLRGGRRCARGVEPGGRSWGLGSGDPAQRPCAQVPDEGTSPRSHARRRPSWISRARSLWRWAGRIFCTKYHRINTCTSKECTESDLYLAGHVERG